MARHGEMRRDYVAEISHGLYDTAGSGENDPALTTAMVRRLNGHEPLKHHGARDGIADEALDNSIAGIRSRGLRRWFVGKDASEQGR